MLRKYLLFDYQLAPRAPACTRLNCDFAIRIKTTGLATVNNSYFNPREINRRVLVT